MRLWSYYALHTFVNSVKKMFRSTVVVVFAAIVLIALIFGFSGGLLMDILEEEGELSAEESASEEPWYVEYYGDEEYGYFDENGEFIYYEALAEAELGGYDENGEFIYYEDAYEQGLGYYDEYGTFIFYYEEFTEEDMQMLLMFVESGTAVLVLFMMCSAIHSGTKKGSDIFLMADVNFLFTAPMKPQSVLLFRLTFQMLATFAGMFYLLFQIPNLVINLKLPVWGCVFCFLAFVLVAVFQKLVSVGTYTYAASHPKALKYVRPCVYAIAIFAAGAMGIAFLAAGKDVVQTLELTLASKWSRLIPVVGWSKAFVIHAIEGNAGPVMAYGILMLLGIAGVTYIIWHIKADFYEDAMAGAQAREDLLAAAGEHRSAAVVADEEKKKKDRRKGKEHGSFVFKQKGAGIFFEKEVLCRKRLAKFGIVTNTMLIYFAIIAGLAYVFTYLLEMDKNSFPIIGFIVMVLLFFRNYGNPIAQETSMNWLFLVPESAYKKVFSAMLAGTYATVMDLLPGLMVSMVVMGLNMATVLLWLAVLVTMDFMLSGVGMVLEALFPASAMDVVKSAIQLVLKFVVILFIVIAIAVGVAISELELGLMINLVMNIVVGAVAFFIYPSMLHGGIA
uniref:putative ABC exporter domain-containing protein n=1 Tax=Agathobacter sp. TaxID=2021311 RepID=UPI004055AC60